jgi:hypothetical protein
VRHARVYFRVQLIDGDPLHVAGHMQNTFTLCTQADSARSFIVSAQSETEKREWMHDIGCGVRVDNQRTPLTDSRANGGDNNSSMLTLTIY